MTSTPKQDTPDASPQLIAVLDELLSTLEKQATTILTALENSPKHWRQEAALTIKDEPSLFVKSFVGKTLGLSNEMLESIHSRRQQVERVRTSVRYLHDQLKTSNNIFAMDLLVDTLTGTYSRFAMDHLLQKLMNSTNENGEHKKIVLAIANIDHLSAINNEHGKESGDMVLKHFGQIANLTLRNTDYVLRYGGDEFMLIMTETDLSSSRTAAERIRDQLKQTPLILEDRYKTSITIKFSAGIAPLHWDGVPEHTIEQTLSALSTAKKSGRNCIKITSL